MQFYGYPLPEWVWPWAWGLGMSLVTVLVIILVVSFLNLMMEWVPAWGRDIQNASEMRRKRLEMTLEFDRKKQEHEVTRLKAVCEIDLKKLEAQREFEMKKIDMELDTLRTMKAEMGFVPIRELAADTDKSLTR